jgi:predicted acylesterase/phospholipase RssA
LWFGAVAGTSAGAITASLIAAGLEPDAIEGAVPDLLKTVRKRRIRMMLGLSDSWFDNRKLADALEGKFRSAIGSSEADRAPVTFRELYESSAPKSEERITLYVVALDLALSWPVIFSVHTTPDVSVTAAVMASTAIPAAFASGRAVWAGDRAPVVHRLVDGGAWANYRRFVFHDLSFRKWIENYADVSLEKETSRPAVGFILGVPPPFDPASPSEVLTNDSRAKEFDQGTMLSTPTSFLWLLGLTLSSKLLRLLLAAAVVLFGIAAWSTMPSFLRDVWGHAYTDSTGALPIVLLLVSMLALSAALAVTLFGAALLLFGQPLADTVVPSATAALAVGTGVPPWLGSDTGDR